MKVIRWIWRNKLSLIAAGLVALASSLAIKQFHKPGQLDVIAAQAMDMSEMRPPTGVALVELAQARRGSLADTVTYTGSVMAFNEQDISPRVTGRLVSLPVYPGDEVHAGELVAQLDTAELAAKTDQALAQFRQAQISQQVALLTHHLHHRAALDAASAELDAANQGVDDALAQARSAGDGVDEAEAGEQSAQAQTAYWQTEIAREKQLADAGAASQQEYQNELAQAQAAQSALSQAQSKVSEARAMLASSRAKVEEARKQVLVADSGKRMALADLEVASAQVQEEGANARSAQSAAREAAVVEGYTRIVSPATGVVTARPVAPGTLVQPGTVVLKVAEIDRVRVQANVAVTDLAGIRVGSPVQIDIIGSSNASIAARVTSVFPSADDQTRTAIVEAVIPNPDHRFFPGAFVTMRISKAVESDRILVPAESILYEDGQPYVWVARGGPSAAKTQAVVQYRASGCGMIYSAADAARYHYICPMDHSKIVPITPAPTQYRASGCGMLYSAADAKKYHYVCPMDHSKLVPVAPVSSQPAESSSQMTANRVDVEVGGSDGTSTEIISSDIQPGDQVVRHGQAGLSDGDRVASVAWGPNGPSTLPTAVQVSGGETRYKCEICGLTFSAADAKKDNYRDPMEGGKLVPIQ